MAKFLIRILKNIPSDQFVGMTDHYVSKDSLQSYIENYELKENQGIGFVVILQSFVKNTNTSSAYFVFFDIATRKILMSDFYTGRDADGYGLTNYWGNGLGPLVKKYIIKVYGKKLKG